MSYKATPAEIFRRYEELAENASDLLNDCLATIDELNSGEYCADYLKIFQNEAIIQELSDMARYAISTISSYNHSQLFANLPQNLRNLCEI